MQIYVTPMRVENGVPVRIGVIMSSRAGDEEDVMRAA